jgi:hypothetical protein
LGYLFDHDSYENFNCLFAHDFYLKLFDYLFKFFIIKFKVLQNNLEKNCYFTKVILSFKYDIFYHIIMS